MSVLETWLQQPAAWVVPILRWLSGAESLKRTLASMLRIVFRDCQTFFAKELQCEDWFLLDVQKKIQTKISEFFSPDKSGSWYLPFFKK